MGTVEGGQPRAMFCGPGEPMVDDDAAIGGKTLSANLNDEEARMAKHRIYKLLDTFEEYVPGKRIYFGQLIEADTSTSDHLREPPFTIQRVCELALNPTSSHKSLGKYLRALQKVLLVTSNWDPLPSSPPPPTQSSSSRLYSQSSAVFGSESPHSSTPLFSPIPFLMESGSLEPDSFRLDEGDPSDSAGVMNPMSLNLDVGPDHSATVRPPNMMMDDPNNHPPNPLILASANSGASVPNGGESADHHREREPFMGRVDEMDSGPLLSSPTIIVSPSNPHALHTNPSAERQYGEGTGESGNMVPHGISERPQAISSTTTLSPMNQEETSSSPEGSPTARKVARLPRTTSMGNLSDRFVKAEVLPSAETAAGSGIQMAAATIDDREEQPSNGTEGGATKMRRVE